MTTFAKMTGGRWFKPRFEARLQEIFRDIGANIRNQYVLAYHPTNPKLDGSYRKLKVEVVAPDGGQFHVHDREGQGVEIPASSPATATRRSTRWSSQADWRPAS